MVICSTSEEEDVCYIETKNLDGETNLKSRHAVPELSNLRTASDCGTSRFRLDAEPACVNMYKLNGAVVFPGEEDAGPGGKPLVHPIDLQTTLLRGCVLRNTSWVIGVVLFTGSDTKIIQNSGGTPSKRSKIERQMNPQVLINLALLAVVAAVCAIIDHFNEKRWDREQTYWELYADTSGDNPSINGLITFLNAFITFQNIVPISLYISIEFVRTAQAAFIYWDHRMKYVRNGITTRTTARSWNLSDDLGQIEYIFSDKTGTLTQNCMIFRQCSVGGKVGLFSSTLCSAVHLTQTQLRLCGRYTLVTTNVLPMTRLSSRQSRVWTRAKKRPPQHPRKSPSPRFWVTMTRSKLNPRQRLPKTQRPHSGIKNSTLNCRKRTLSNPAFYMASSLSSDCATQLWLPRTNRVKSSTRHNPLMRLLLCKRLLMSALCFADVIAISCA